MQSQNAGPAHFTSKQVLSSGFAEYPIHLSGLPSRVLCSAESFQVEVLTFSAKRVGRETRYTSNVGLMLGQRLRRWANIKPTLF